MGLELQTKTDCATIKGINGIVKIQSESMVIILIERPNLVNADLPKVSVDTSVQFICLCQSVAWYDITDAVVVEFVGYRSETCHDITKTVLISKLCHTHYKETVVTGEVPDTIVTVVTGYTIVKLTSWYERHNPGKNGASLWHGGKITGDSRKCSKLYRVHTPKVL